jgi:hypothetical protein
MTTDIKKQQNYKLSKGLVIISDKMGFRKNYKIHKKYSKEFKLQ